MLNIILRPKFVLFASAFGFANYTDIGLNSSSYPTRLYIYIYIYIYINIATAPVYALLCLLCQQLNR